MKPKTLADIKHENKRLRARVTELEQENSNLLHELGKLASEKLKVKR